MKRIWVSLLLSMFLVFCANAGEFTYGFVTDNLDISVTSADAEPQTVDVHVDLLPNVTILGARIVLNVGDPDYPDEGELYINGTFAMPLFGNQGGSQHDNKTVSVSYPIDHTLLVNGQNFFTFTRVKTVGYSVYKVEVQLDGSYVPGEDDPDPPVPGEYVTISEFNLATEALRVEREVRLAEEHDSIMTEVKRLLADIWGIALSYVQ